MSVLKESAAAQAELPVLRGVLEFKPQRTYRDAEFDVAAERGWQMGIRAGKEFKRKLAALHRPRCPSL